MVILVSIVAGALASFLAALPGVIRLKWQLRAARRRIADLEAAAARAATPVPAPGPDVGAGVRAERPVSAPIAASAGHMK